MTEDDKARDVIGSGPHPLDSLRAGIRWTGDVPLWSHRARRSVCCEEKDRGNAPRRSAAGLLAMLESGVRSAAFQSSVEKLWAGSFLLCLEAVHGFSAERQRQ